MPLCGLLYKKNMSNINTILIKRRTTGEAGAPASLSGGELAFNEVNSVLYYGSENGVIPIGGSGEFATNTLVGSISADLSSQIGTLDLRVTDEVATLNTTIQSVSSTLDAKIDAQIAAVIDFAPDALNTLNELASALGDDENFASNLVSTLGNVNSTIASVSSTLDSKIDSEVSTLNSTVQSVSASLESAISSLNSDSTSQIASLSAELKGDISTEEAARIAADSALTSTVQSVSATLDSKIDSEVADLESAIADEVTRATDAEGVLDSKIDSEVSTLNSTIASLSSSVDSEVAALEASISSLNTYVDTNFLNLTGGNISGDLEVSGSITASNGLEISTGGGSTSLFVGSNVVGINTEAPTEALEVVGNGKFSGTVEVAAPTVNGHAANKGYVDTAIANLVDGAPALLDTLNELAAAINDDASFAATIATNIGNVSTALASVSATLDSKIDSEVATLEASIVSEVATLNSTISDEVTRATAAEGALDTRVSDIEGNYLDKRVGGTVVGQISVTAPSQIDIGFATNGEIHASGRFYTDNGVEANHVTANSGTFNGEVTVAEPTLSTSAATKNYVDYMISIIDGGTF